MSRRSIVRAATLGAGVMAASLAAASAVVVIFRDDLSGGLGMSSLALLSASVVGFGLVAMAQVDRRRAAARDADERSTIRRSHRAVVVRLDQQDAALKRLSAQVDDLRTALANSRGSAEPTVSGGRSRSQAGAAEAQPARLSPADGYTSSRGNDATTVATDRSRQVDPEEVAESVWFEPHGVRSSYMYKLHESKRRHRLLPLLGHRQRIWAFNDKVSGYALAESSGLEIPRTLQGSVTLDELDWASLPNRFVIKPHGGAANRGVFLLVRRSGERFDNLMDGSQISAVDVVAAYSEYVQRGEITAEFGIEELLEPRPELADRIGIPDDLKVYCFYDRPTLIMQRRMNGQADRSKWQFKLWTVDWDDFGPAKFADRYAEELEAPAGGAEILEAAARLGRSLSVPFVRLDFYDTARGAVFGELTPHPGPPEVFESGADEFLGRHWEIAETRLLAEGTLPSEPRPTGR